jgi:hypothetical protein
LSLNEFNTKFGIDVSRPLYRSFQRVFETSKLRFGKDVPLQGMSLQTFFANWKRGSKKIRKLMAPVTNNIPHNIIKFSENAEIVVGIEDSKLLNNVWTARFISNAMRTFIFKLHNNTLPFNTVLSHFVREQTRNCTFCDLVRVPEEEDETVLHLFYDCMVSERTRNTFFNWITNDNNFTLSRQRFFGVYAGINMYDDCFVFWTIQIFFYYLWQCKLKKTLPVLESLKKFYWTEIKTMSECCGDFKAKLNKSQLWLNLQQRVRAGL